MSGIDWFGRPTSEQTDIIASGFPEPRRSNNSKIPPEAREIPILNGGSLMPSGYYKVNRGGRVEYIGNDGEPLAGKELESARRFDSAQEKGMVFDVGQGREISIGQAQEGAQGGTLRQSDGMTQEQAAERAQGLSREAESNRRMRDSTDYANVNFNSWGGAVLTIPESVRNKIRFAAPTVTVSNAMDLEAEDARMVYEQTFHKPVPADMSPQQALREELRNMRRGQ